MVVIRDCVIHTHIWWWRESNGFLFSLVCCLVVGMSECAHFRRTRARVCWPECNVRVAATVWCCRRRRKKYPRTVTGRNDNKSDLFKLKNVRSMKKTLSLYGFLSVRSIFLTLSPARFAVSVCLSVFLPVSLSLSVILVAFVKVLIHRIHFSDCALSVHHFHSNKVFRRSRRSRAPTPLPDFVFFLFFLLLSYFTRSIWYIRINALYASNDSNLMQTINSLIVKRRFRIYLTFFSLSTSSGILCCCFRVESFLFFSMISTWT